MDKISDVFETLTDWIINLKNYIFLIAEKASVWLCHHHNLFSFDWIFLKLANKVDMDENSHKFET